MVTLIQSRESCHGRSFQRSWVELQTRSIARCPPNSIPGDTSESTQAIPSTSLSLLRSGFGAVRRAWPMLTPSSRTLWDRTVDELLEPALSTRILGLFYKAVSREVFVFSVVNRLLVRRLLRPALIAEQFCHVHLPSNLSEQADHFLRSQLPPSYPHVCSNVLRQRPILGRDFVREIVP